MNQGSWGRAFVVLAVIGATLGSALDAIHTHTGTTSYPAPAFFMMAWWVPPLFGAAAVGMGLARPLWERALGLRTPGPSTERALAGMALFILAYGLSGVMTGSWTLRAVVLALLSAGIWVLCDCSALGLMLATATAVVGISGEVALVHAGAFKYLHPDFFGVAGWLPWLYTAAALAVGNLGKRLVDARAS